MKRALALILAAGFVVSMAIGCGGDTPAPKKDEKPKAAPVKTDKDATPPAKTDKDATPPAKTDK